MTTAEACPYQIRQTASGWHVVRPQLGGGCFTVAGPFNTRYEAEAAALRRWRGEGRRAA